MKKLFVTLSVLTSLLTPFANAENSADLSGGYLGHVNLGSTLLSYGPDLNTVVVNSCDHGMLIDSVKMQITKRAADIDYILITLGNGARLELPVKQTFREDTESQWFNLSGRLCISSFAVYGDTRSALPIFGKAKVTLIGNAYEL